MHATAHPISLTLTAPPPWRRSCASRWHWVETEAGISISFSIPFDTEFVERAEAVVRINKRMRRLHLSPRPIGSSERVDKARAAVARSITRLAGRHRRD